MSNEMRLLSREEWTRLWLSVKALELQANAMPDSSMYRQRILVHTAEMKKVIQSVVGKIE